MVNKTQLFCIQVPPHLLPHIVLTFSVALSFSWNPVIFHFSTIIFSDLTTNRKQVLLNWYSCQMIHFSTTLRPRRKGPLPRDRHYREPTLAHWPGTSTYSEKSAQPRAMLSDSSAIYLSRLPGPWIPMQIPELSILGKMEMEALGVVKRQLIRDEARLLVKWACGHAMAKKEPWVRGKGGTLQGTEALTEGHFPLPLRSTTELKNLRLLNGHPSHLKLYLSN